MPHDPGPLDVRQSQRLARFNRNPITVATASVIAGTPAGSRGNDAAQIAERTV